MRNPQMPRIESYAEARSRLGRIGHNTYVVHRDDAYVVEYHGNPIVLFLQNGGVYVSNAGWATCTTNRRINLIVGKFCHAFIKNHESRLTVGDTTHDLNGYWVQVA